MKKVIALKHEYQGYNDNTENLSYQYGLRYDEIETNRGYVMLFTLRESISDNRTREYFQELLCYIFNTEPVNDIYDGSDTTHDVSIFTILLIFVNCMRSQYNDRHYKEHLRQFHQSRGIETKAGLPELHLLKDGSYTLTPIQLYQFGYEVYQRNDDQKIQGNTQKQTTNRSKNHRALYRNFKWDDLYGSCALYSDFCDGNGYMNTEDVLFLARGLCGAEHGKQHFLELIQQQPKALYASLNWNEILTAIIKNDMPIPSCEQCEYSDCCNHSEHMLATAKPMKQEIRLLKKQEYVPLEEAEEDLQFAFQRAVQMQDNDIHIIKAQTGLGKTETYLQYMKNASTPLIVAVPTHELKYEIFRRADSMGIQDICCTPYLNDFSFSDEIQDKINHLYQVGAGEYVLKYLAGILKKIKPNEADYLQISEYLKQQKRASRFKGHIITTHANLLHMSKEILSSHTVIIDEDIFRTLLNTSSINTEDLLELERSNILTAEEQSKLRFFHYYYNYQKVKLINVLQSEDKIRKIQNLDINICGLMRAEYAYISKTQIHFIEEQKLPECKVIILSATVDPELYRMLYPERNIDFYACKKARYKGKILQYTDSSYSRYVLTNHDYVMDKVKRSTADETVITFQEIEKELGTRYHFGNIEGLDHLAGKPLSIVGLPNLHEIVYCLYGMRLGSELKKQKMNTHRIQYNDYSFSLNTYQDEILQRIQIWMLSSQLEQAVGRARLLRNNGTVTVFAGFPVEQAEYIWK